MNKFDVSVVILTYNNEKTIRNCLKSVQVFKDIILLDGGSKDKTLVIAKKFKCRVLHQPKEFKFKDNKIANFAKMRNFAIKKTKYNYVLNVDADEKLSKELIQNILKILKKNKKNKIDLCLVERRYIMNNKIIKYSAFYPNFQEKLINKKSCFYKNEVHERINFIFKKKKAQIIKLKGFIYSDFDKDLKKIIRKWNYYLNIQIKNDNKNFIQLIRDLSVRTMASFKILLKIFLKSIVYFNNKNKMPEKYELLLIFYYQKISILFLLNYLSRIFLRRNINF